MARELNELVLADMIAARAEARPDLDVVTFESETGADEIRTYADLWVNANKLAAGLLARGMEYGDRFAILIRNHPEFIELMIAASLTGLVFVPIDPRTRGAKLAYTLNNSGCRGIVCADYSLAQVEEIRGQVPSLEWLWLLDSGENPDAPFASATDIREILSGPDTSVDLRLRDPGDALQILYTSGTTGDPKGVVFANARYGMASMLAMMLGIGADERPYTGLSLTHGNAQLMTLASALRLGQRAVFSRKFTKSRLWDITRKYGCTFFNLLGGMSTAIYSEPVRPDDADNPVRFVLSSGMPAAIWENFEQRFDLKILEAYGAIEGGMAFKPIGVGPIGSFGKPPPTMEIKIVDEENNECPPGVPGELVSRAATGEAASVSYFKNDAASQKKTEGGWLRSGDICHRDAEGWLFFDYRKGGGIRHNGDFINPGFVEGVLAENPQVLDVYVYGIASANGSPGEKDAVAAIVVDRFAFDPSAVFAWCRDKLEPNFVPTYLQVVDEIPKTASEKPQDRFLIEALCASGAEIYEWRNGMAVRKEGGLKP
ncbi:MAG: AMP-binding protein [Alphaproteobacteria bacterium]|nr:AMP-binding protein [Alphaproteobacteria bacterium]MDE2014364.1 AMP-binding protein [Alphaproteobacteria bacterium]